MQAAKIILGVDPGSRKMGYGIIETKGYRARYIASGCIQSQPQSFISLFEGLHTIIQEYKPTEAAIEEVFLHRNPKSALTLGQARGVALLALEIARLPVRHYAARQVKKAITGYGAANKLQMQKMIKQLLYLSDIPSADAADALSIAFCHHNFQF